jgi:hypothetical protein
MPSIFFNITKDKMKSLKSNGPGSIGDWMGADDTALEYPGVDTCITVTCLVGNKLIGCHLYHCWRFPYLADLHNQSIADFAKAAKKLGPVKAVYIIGNIGHWGAHISALAKQLKDALGYIGVFGGSNPSDCTGDIAVTLKGPVAVEFTRNGVKLQLTLLDT